MDSRNLRQPRFDRQIIMLFLIVIFEIVREWLAALYPHRLQSMSSFLLSSDAPPLWGLLNILALLAGAWLAALLVGKRPARSRYSSNERALPAGSGTSGSRTGSLPA